MQCLRCQHENLTGSNYCLGCRARFGISCGSCGTELPAGSRFCNKCSTPVALESTDQFRFGFPESYTPRHLAEKILTSKAALESERKRVSALTGASAQRTRLSAAAARGLPRFVGPDPDHLVFQKAAA